MNPESSRTDLTAVQGDLCCDDVTVHSNGAETDYDTQSPISKRGPVNDGVLTSESVDSSSNQVGLQVRTRFGRLVKSVNRLIQNMTQNVKTTSSVSEFARSLLS